MTDNDKITLPAPGAPAPGALGAVSAPSKDITIHVSWDQTLKGDIVSALTWSEHTKNLTVKELHALADHLTAIMRNSIASARKALR